MIILLLYKIHLKWQIFNLETEKIRTFYCDFHRYPIIFQKAGIPSAFKRKKFDFWKSDFGRFSCPKQLRSKLPVSSRRMQCEARSGFASEKRGECTIVLDPSGERSKARDCPQCAAVGCFLWDSCEKTCIFIRPMLYYKQYYLFNTRCDLWQFARIRKMTEPKKVL